MTNNKLDEKKKVRRRKRKYDSISYLTGDIGLNIDRFNRAMGTHDIDTNSGDTSDNFSNGCDGGCSESLTEANRYVRRYYIRPQNIFCSNKAEIIKALIELDDANCSVYTLNNLGDDKDVPKLMNSDIIYYYDGGILYDKNKIKVMDYDLSIKKEENRKHFANVNKTPEKEFKNEYADRMTNVTELEEDFEADLLNSGIFDDCDYEVISAGYTDSGDEVVISLNHNVTNIEVAAKHLIDCLSKLNINIIDWNTNGSNVFIFSIEPENAFDLTFEDYNVFGEKLTESKQHYCCICGEPLDDYGNNPEPYMSADKGQCCDGCNLKFVVPLRMDLMKEDE